MFSVTFNATNTGYAQLIISKIKDKSEVEQSKLTKYQYISNLKNINQIETEALNYFFRYQKYNWKDKHKIYYEKNEGKHKVIDLQKTMEEINA
ncbi:MAG: hypothetical protein ACK5HS_04580 [Mycoplasmatales bacterium]